MSPLGMGGPLSQGGSAAAFRGWPKGPAVIQVPLAQSNHYARAAYFAVAYSATLQASVTKWQGLGGFTTKHLFVAVLVHG